MTTKKEEKQPKRQSQAGKWIIGLFLFVILVALTWVPLTDKWPRLSCNEVEMDLSSGRFRYTPYFLFIQLPQRIKDTPISEMLAKHSVPTGEADWRYITRSVKTDSCGVKCHPVLGSSLSLWCLWENFHFTDKARLKTAKQLRTIWQESDLNIYGPDLFFDYLYNLVRAKAASDDPTKPTTAADIPDDLAERSIAAWKSGLKKGEKEQ